MSKFNRDIKISFEDRLLFLSTVAALLIILFDLSLSAYLYLSGLKLGTLIDTVGGILFYNVRGNTLLNTIIVDTIGLIIYLFFAIKIHSKRPLFKRNFQEDFRQLGHLAINLLVIIAFLLQILSGRYLNLL